MLFLKRLEEYGETVMIDPKDARVIRDEEEENKEYLEAER